MTTAIKRVAPAAAGTPGGWSAAKARRLPEEESAAGLAALRERGYLIVRGRGRGAFYGLRRGLAGRLRGAMPSATVLQRERSKRCSEHSRCRDTPEMYVTQRFWAVRPPPAPAGDTP